MKTKLIFSICIFYMFILCLLPGTGFSMGSRGNNTATEFNLEVILPLTGNLAFLGTPVQNGVILAHEEWEARLSQQNISINLIFGDSQGNPKNAVTIHSQNKIMKDILHMDQPTYLSEHCRHKPL